MIILNNKILSDSNWCLCACVRACMCVSDVQYISYIVIINIIFHYRDYHMSFSYIDISQCSNLRYNHVHNVMFTFLSRVNISVCLC